MSETTEFKFSPLQEKWLRALESGEWKQCKGALKEGGGYCCLGVACVIAGLKPQKSPHGDDSFVGADGAVVYSIAPIDIVQGFQLRSETGCIEGSRSLAEMNDDGKTFAEIAAFIRANPRAVFVEPSPCSPQ